MEARRLDATPIRSRDDLVAIVRRRQEELGVACLTVDEVAGLASGHFAKLTSQVKGFGFLSMFLVLEALGLRIRIEEDPEAKSKLASRWSSRDDRYVRTDNHWRRAG
jgi:hypothetical protein